MNQSQLLAAGQVRFPPRWPPKRVGRMRGSCLDLPYESEAACSVHNPLKEEKSQLFQLHSL